MSSSDKITIVYSLSDKLFNPFSKEKSNTVTDMETADYKENKVRIHPKLLYDNLNKLCYNRKTFYEYFIEDSIVKPYIDVDKMYCNGILIEDPLIILDHLKKMMLNLKSQFKLKYNFDLSFNITGYTNIQGIDVLEDENGIFTNFLYKPNTDKKFSAHVVITNVKCNYTSNGKALLENIVKDSNLYKEYSDFVFDSSVYNINRKLRHVAAHKDDSYDIMYKDKYTPVFVSGIKKEMEILYYKTSEGTKHFAKTIVKPMPENLEFKKREVKKAEPKKDESQTVESKKVNSKSYIEEYTIIDGVEYIIKRNKPAPFAGTKFVKQCAVEMEEDLFYECCISYTEKIDKHLECDELEFIFDECFKYIEDNKLYRVKEEMDNSTFIRKTNSRKKITVQNEITCKDITIDEEMEFKNKYTHLFYQIYFNWDFNDVLKDWTVLLHDSPIELSEMELAFEEAYMTKEHTQPLPSNILTYFSHDQFGLKSLYTYKKRVYNDKRFDLIQEYYDDQKTLADLRVSSINKKKIVEKWKDNELFKKFNRLKTIRDKVTATIHKLIQQTKRRCFIAQDYTYDDLVKQYMYFEKVDSGMLMLDFCRVLCICRGNFYLKCKDDIKKLTKENLINEILDINVKNITPFDYISFARNVSVFVNVEQMNDKLLNIKDNLSANELDLIHEFFDLMELSYENKNDFHILLDRESYRLSGGLKRCGLSMLNIGNGADYKSKFAQFLGAVYPTSMCDLSIGSFKKEQQASVLINNYLNIEELPTTINDCEYLWNIIKSYNVDIISSRYMGKDQFKFKNMFCLDFNTNNPDVQLFNSDMNQRAAFRRVVIVKRKQIGEEYYQRLDEIFANPKLPQLFRNYIVYNYNRAGEEKYHIRFNDEFMSFEDYYNKIRNACKIDDVYLSEYEFNFWNNHKPISDVKFDIQCNITQYNNWFRLDMDGAIYDMMKQSRNVGKKLTENLCEDMIKKVLGGDYKKKQSIRIDGKSCTINGFIFKEEIKNRLLDHFQEIPPNDGDEKKTNSNCLVSEQTKGLE